MRVLVAGATGTIGASLVEKLLTSGHEVIGLRRRAGGQAEVCWVTADVLDRDGLLHAVSGVRADAVVSELSALKKPPARHRAMAATNTLRTRGTANLLEVARQIGARRFVTQSMMFGYGYDDQGLRLRRESEPFAPEHQGPWEAHLAAMRENERMVLTDHSVEGVALRYALFYGAGASQPLIDGVAHRKLPVLATASPLSWIHVDDAASATVAALERGEAGQAYNIADDEPVSATWRLGRAHHHAPTDERITDVPDATKRGPLQNDGVIDPGLADHAVVADGGVRADVTVADHGVGTDHDRTDDP